MKKSLILLLFAFSLATNVLIAKSPKTYEYAVPQYSWEESLGNHRAVLQIEKAASVVALDFDWRRADKNVEEHQFLIVNATTGDTVRNILRQSVNREHCQLLFGPVSEKGTYYFYYLPYRVLTGGGFYGDGYKPQEEGPDKTWVSTAISKKKHTEVKVVRVESRTQFDSFFPMEVAASAKECADYLKSQEQSHFLVFPEDRKNPIRMRENFPVKWLDIQQGAGFKGAAAPNEYYTFQLGIWAAKGDVRKVSYKASDLIGDSGILPSSSITCFNTEGINPYGEAFTKEVNVAEGHVLALWFGVDVPLSAKEGIYAGNIELQDADGNVSKVPVSIRVEGSPLADRGDAEPWRHSRLRWLNSTLGIADTPTNRYTPLTLTDNRIGCWGRSLEFGDNTLLPKQINAWDNPMLSQPIRVVIETSDGIKKLQAIPQIQEQTEGHISSIWTAEDTDLKINAKMRMEFDGWVDYIYTILPKHALNVKDIRLEISMYNDIASYFLGAGLPGQDTPQEYEGKWDTPEKTVNTFGVSLTTDKKQNWLWPFDSFWMGNANAGIHCELRGSNYTGPLLNSYRPPYPESWNNEGRGGFRVQKGQDATTVTCFSGERTLEAGKPIDFEFALLITPVKTIDMKGQFTNRYYHNGHNPVPTEEDMKAGIKIINIHHANFLNPFINYPFLTANKIKQFTNEWHKKGCKVKLYYTLRELTSATTEIWAIRSLGTEILRGGKGGGFPWLREHMVEDYTPQWYQHFDHVDDTGIVADAAVLTSESNSRWYNYYVEGLRWMIENLDLDGIYLDDVSYDRRILKRMRRAMDSVKPGCLIDLHSNTGFSKGPANQYAEYFPYIDKVWFGESFLYNQMTPANWLVESSGIPFGHTGDMLYRGGNKWLGMQYGMTVRHPWDTEGIICDPRIVWRVWDDFGIADADVLGFWEKNPAVVASDPTVKVTAFRKKGRVLLSLGNYSDETKTINLNFDWKQLDIDANDAEMVAPEVEDFQLSAHWPTDGMITIQPRKGWLIYLQPKN